MNNQKIIFDKLFAGCILIFGKNLQCILHIGSSLNNSNIPNDIDLILILKKRETVVDLIRLRDILKNVKFTPDIQLINMLDINESGWNFSHFTHGQFFIYFLKSSKVIFGTNPFRGINLDDRYLTSSVFQKVQYYYCRAKKFLLENKYEGVILSEKDLHFHRKKILLMLVDYWLVISKQTFNINNCDFKQVLDSLNLSVFYSDHLIFFQNGRAKYNFDYVFNIYQNIYFAILDSLNVYVTKKMITQNEIL